MCGARYVAFDVRDDDPIIAQRLEVSRNPVLQFVFD